MRCGRCRDTRELAGGCSVVARVVVVAGVVAVLRMMGITLLDILLPHMVSLGARFFQRQLADAVFGQLGPSGTCPGWTPCTRRTDDVRSCQGPPAAVFSRFTNENPLWAKLGNFSKENMEKSHPALSSCDTPCQKCFAGRLNIYE